MAGRAHRRPGGGWSCRRTKGRWRSWAWYRAATSFEGGRRWTSALRSVDAERSFVATQNSIFRLGLAGAREPLEPDAQYVWPPALTVAACSNWNVAVFDAAHFTGRAYAAGAAADGAGGRRRDGDWPSRGRLLRDRGAPAVAGRRVVAEAWSLLGCRPNGVRTTASGGRFGRRAATAGPRMYERALTVDEAMAENGWRLLGAMDDAEVGKLHAEGVAA